VAKVFTDSKSAGEWQKFRRVVVAEEFRFKIDNLRCLESTGFLKVYKDKLHPTLILKLLNIQDHIIGFKLVLLSAIVKEYYKYPSKQFDKISLPMPWWYIASINPTPV
jgi:hypothetical protein